ncbi:hypothetical protein ACJ73_06894 [Blastomyces percursus]|uniref:Uncharacterized protein n=1 Tax=Blastomyces percursus TaxID=1658174 RepID=A0A1J9PZN0_9EURO|nr:hypothetical protein ACJ73_06894 [Blastomyces percursus]
MDEKLASYIMRIFGDAAPQNELHIPDLLKIKQLPIRQRPNTQSEVIPDDELYMYCQASDDEEEQWDMSDDEEDILAKKVIPLMMRDLVKIVKLI